MLAIDQSVSEPRVVVLAKTAWAEDLYQKLSKEFHPYCLWTKPDAGWAIGNGKGSDEVYVCLEGRCLSPSKSAAEVTAQLSASKF